MKKDADMSGAEVAPTSGTEGMEGGRGVLSIRTVWWKRDSLFPVPDMMGELD